jgi:hypothetical protein
MLDRGYTLEQIQKVFLSIKAELFYLDVKGVRTMYRQGGEKVYQQRGADPGGFTSSGGLGEGREAA